jgi:hypothetical protein
MKYIEINWNVLNPKKPNMDLYQYISLFPSIPNYFHLFLMSDSFFIIIFIFYIEYLTSL